jgi:minimal CRISPR polymerase-like protein
VHWHWNRRESHEQHRSSKSRRGTSRCRSVGDKLELCLLREDIDGAKSLHRQIQESMRWLRQALAEQVGCELLYSGCDDILFQIEAERYDHYTVEQLRGRFQSRTGCTLSYRFGGTISEALRNLHEAKLSGRNRAVGSASLPSDECRKSATLKVR